MTAGASSNVPYKEIIDRMSTGVLFIDAGDRIAYCNDVAATLWQSSPADMIGRVIWDCHPPERASNVRDVLDGFRNGTGIHTTWMNDRRSQFVEHWLSPAYDDTGAYIGAVLVSVDVTAREAARARYETMAHTDAATGLLNRNFFLEVFPAYQQRLGRDITSLAILMTDINGLKKVNDTHGHAAGDRLIGKAAEVIKSCVRSSDPVFRFGGDEFIALLPGGTRQAARNAYRRIKAGCRRWSAAHPELPLSLSVGWAVARTPQEAATILAEADEAMYRDKAAQKT